MKMRELKFHKMLLLGILMYQKTKDPIFQDKDLMNGTQSFTTPKSIHEAQRLYGVCQSTL